MEPKKYVFKPWPKYSLNESVGGRGEPPSQRRHGTDPRLRRFRKPPSPASEQEGEHQGLRRFAARQRPGDGVTKPSAKSPRSTPAVCLRDPATPALGGGNHVGDAEIRLQDAVNTPVVLTHPMRVQLKPVLHQQMQTHRSRCTGIKQESGVPFLWVTRVSRKQAVQQVQASLGSPVPPGGTPSACGQASGSRAGRQEPSEGHEAVCGAPAKAGSRRRPAVV